MKKKILAKKTLSVFLAVLMIMTSWVFFPGMVSFEAEAIDAGDAVTAYNKELLNQIKTDPDTNMVTTTNNKYKRTDNGKLGDTNSNVTSTHLSNSYQNVLNFNNGNIVTSGTGSAVTIISGTANADSVQVWYPDTVLMYDGGKAKMAVLLEADSNGSSLRTVSCYLDGDADGLYLGYDESNPYWRGHSDDDPAVMYCLWIGSSGFQATTNGTKHSSYIFGCKNWSFSATHLYFTGTMSDTEWVRTYNPKWSYRGGTNDDSVHGPVKATGHTIYVMNIQGYKRLVQDIISKKGTLNGKEGQYTRDSLQRFVNACNKITKDLAPKNFVSTTSNNVTSWASQMSTAYTELNNAYNGLTKRNVNVTYENLFSINDWAASASANLQSSASVEIAVENNDTVKIYKNSAGGEVTTASSYSGNHKDTMYSMPVTGGKDYTVRYDIEASVSGTAQSEVFMFWYDANNNPVVGTNNGTNTFNNKGFGSTGACSVTFTAPASATKVEIRFDNDCPSSGSTLRFKNIAVYPAERNTAVEVDSWTTRPVTKSVTSGSTLSGKLDVPVRDGYTFNGWYIDNVNVNGVKDSGEEVTDAAGNVTKSVTVANSINLYADWKPLPMDIGYDNMFSLAEWAKTQSTKISGNGSATYDVMAGTITVECASGGETYTNYGSGSTQYKVAVEPETDYVFEADLSFTAGNKGQMFVFFYDANGNALAGSTWYERGTGVPETASHIGIYPTTAGTSKITFKTPANCTQVGFRVGSTGAGFTTVYSNIGFYNKADYDAYAKDYATIRVPFNFGDTTNLALVPTREGYQFDGWYTANGTKLTSVTGLTASDTVYAKWTQLFTVTFKNWDGTVLKTQQVAPGAAATAPQNPNRAGDKDYEYDFDKWDTDFSAVTSDLVVTATFKSKDHTGISKTYQSAATCTKAATYTQLCTKCGFVWTEIFEDPAMPALGHTYERENPSSTVVTGTSTGKKDTDLHTIKCNACDATTQVKHDFKDDATRPGTTATCTVKGWTYTKCACLETQEIEGQTNPNNHVNTSIVGKVDATCTADGYTGDEICDACSAVVKKGEVDSKKGHNWSQTDKFLKSAADCNNAAVYYEECLTCGISAENDTTNTGKTYSKGEALDHLFTKYVDQGDATCDKEGTEIATCDRDGCNATDSRSTGKKREHNFNTTPVVTTNNNGTHTYTYKCAYDDCSATTTNNQNCGYGAWTKDDATTHSHTCTTCGYTPAAEAHDWSAWTTVGGSATEKATQTRSCTVCGRVEDTDCNYAVKDYKAATCEAPEITTYECSDCKHGYSVIGEGAKSHNFTKESGVKNNGDGTHSFACANGCGEYGFGTTKNASVACSDWTYANTEAGKHTATCDDCGYVKTENCSGGEATCTAKAVCQFCNTAYGELADHNYGGNTYFEGVEKAEEATCTAQAEYYTYCLACKKSSKGTDKEATFAYGDLLPHTFTGNTEFLYKATDAKCEANETYYVYCSECKASSKGTAEEATFEKADTALEHVWVNAQHNADTLTHTFTCERGCGKTMTANCADSAVSYGYEPATCTAQGYDIVQCSACGHQWNINYTDALGHDYTQKIYDEAHLKSAANCEQANVYYYDCSRCDKNAKDETDTEKYTTLTYISGEVRKHDFHNKVDDKYLADEATCFAAAKYFTSCKYEDCGKSSEEVYGVGNGTKFSSGTALAHNWAEVEDAKYLATKADCANDATYYYECSLCKNSSKDYGDGATWTDVDSKSGHSMAYTAAKAATCYEAGNLEYWYCDTCKKYYKDAEGTDAYLGQSETVIKKREHDLATFSFKDHTCEEDGHPAYVDCKYEDCDYTTLPAVLPNGYKATGHNFTGAYTYDTVNLYHSRLCANGCGVSGMVVDGAQVKYEVTFNGEDEAVIVGGEKCEFTYTERTKNGVHSHANACVCGNNTTKTYSDEETFVETVAPTCTTKGYDSYACPDCGATWTKNEKAANGHTAAETATSNGDGTHSIYCTVEGCGYKISTTKCSGGEATCKDQAICDICKAAYGEKGTHVYDETKWVYQNDAKCGVNGTEKNTCLKCNEEQSREKKDSALKHVKSEFVTSLPEGVTVENFDATALKEPNCGTEGYAVQYCTVCFEKLAAKTVPAVKDNHQYGEYVAVGGNCATGVTLQATCGVCGKTDVKTGPAEHDWKVTFYKESTCTANGYREWQCSVCKFVIKEFYGYDGENSQNNEDLAKKSHVINKDGEPYEVIPATCTKKAQNVYKCEFCDEKEYVDVENSLIAHELIHTKAQEADCVFAGNVEHWICSNCSSIFADENAETALEDVVIPVKEHKVNAETGKCEKCGRVIYDNGHKSCGCICHKENVLMRFLYKIINFFWKLFKISKSCDCGNIHWN